MRTRRDIEFKDWGIGSLKRTFVVPKGTPLMEIPADGQGRKGDYWVDRFDWIQNDALLTHDAIHYGIRVQIEDAEERTSLDRLIGEACDAEELLGIDECDQSR